MKQVELRILFNVTEEDFKSKEFKKTLEEARGCSAMLKDENQCKYKLFNILSEVKVR